MDEKEMSIEETENKSSSSEDEDDKEEKALLSKAEELERNLSTNKFLYDAHEEVVSLYRKLGDLKSMRAAYKRFHECFPLTPKLWLGWIKDEIKIAQTSEEQKQIFKLFDEAVEDYLSIDLWIEYAQYSIGVSDLETTRSIIERGLMAGGLHASKGSLLWDTLRELEHAHVSLHQEGSDEWKAQIKRLADVFKRQLSVPLLRMNEVFLEWQAWSETLPDGLIDKEPVEWAYKKAMNLLDTYKPFEEKLLASEQYNNELLEVYKEYIKSVKDPSTVICLYERAVLPLCLTPDLWMDYCTTALKLGETAIKVVNRAVRNCPWSEDLWIMKLRITEHLNKGEADILSSFEEGLNSISPNPGLNLWMSYLEYFRRNCNDKKKLNTLCEQAMVQIGIESDPTSKLSRFCARILAKQGDMESAQKIWNSILSHKCNKDSASLWLEYANLERQYGDEINTRAVFIKAVSKKIDWPQYVADEWLMFEREVGTVNDVLKCTEKIRSVIKAEEVVQNQHLNHENILNENNTKKRKDRNDYNSNNNKRSRIDPKEEQETVAPKRRIDKNPKTTVFVSNLLSNVTEDKLKELFPKADIIEIVKTHKGKSRGYGYIQFQKEEEVMTALANDRIPLDGRPVYVSEVRTEGSVRKPSLRYPDALEKNKLFIRGLPFSKTQQEIEEIFKPHNPKAVRLVTRNNGRSKGIAYVEFENEEAAQNALNATDQTTIDDKIITVVYSAPPPKKPKITEEKEPRARSKILLLPTLIPSQLLQVKEKYKENGGSASKEAPKSNADFRDMFLKK